jgi:hypothetical protein
LYPHPSRMIKATGRMRSSSVSQEILRVALFY